MSSQPCEPATWTCLADRRAKTDGLDQIEIQRPASAWLERFHDPAVPKAVAGTAVIPEVTDQLRSLWRVNQALLDCIQTHRPATTATLDMDATLIETHKRDALHCYKGFKAYQPLNCWWFEQGAMLY